MIDRITQCQIHLAHEDLSNQLAVSDRLIDCINRGIDMTERIKTLYKPEDMISPEVLEYISEYEDACEALGWNKISVEVSCESALDVVKSIVRSLWNMLCKLWEYIRNGFRYVFNAQYRASKDAVKCSQEIALLNSNREASEKFERYEVDAMMKPEDLRKYMEATTKLIEIMEQVPTMDDPETVDGFVTGRVPDCGLVFKNGRFEDTYENIPYYGGTYGSLGWTAKLAYDASKYYIDLTRRGVVLKKLESSLSNDVADLKRKQSSMIADGADITTVQQTLTYKVKLYQVIHAAQEALLKRIDTLDTEFANMAEDANAVATGKYELNDDDE